MQREQLIQAWLLKLFPEQEVSTEFLAGDASFRRYARIKVADRSYMLMDAPPEQEDCTPFIRVAAYLDQHGARVPHIVAKDLVQGFLLLEDFGDQLLSTVLNEETVDAHYAQAFAQIIQLQTITADSTVFPEYSEEKLLQEMRLFEEWMFPSLGIVMTSDVQKMLDVSYQWIIDNLKQQPQVIVHRDYHSRNLMLLTDEKDLGIIDFQDAVLGADTYDLISIIRDAYVQWQPERVQAWIELFYFMLPETARENRDLNQFKHDVEVMSIQRHLKILGIFVRLYVRDAKSGYLKDLPRVMWYLRQELAAISELAALRNFIEQEVMPQFILKYGDYIEVTA